MSGTLRFSHSKFGASNFVPFLFPSHPVRCARFEFATNEYVNDLACVQLETSSTETGSKDFIAVGTTIDRGEDLAAKGAVSRRVLPELYYPEDAILITDSFCFCRVAVIPPS